MTERYTRIALDKIVASPFQYRQTFGGTDDDELTASISSHGVLTPIRVRANGTPETFELIYGERRLRCSRRAGLADIPAIVVEATDDQAIEQLLVENLRRADVNGVEEGEGYRKLIDSHGWTVERLVDRTGKSKAWIYGRLKLAELVPEVREAALSGRIQTSVAEIIARQPTTSLQTELLKDVLGLTDGDYQADIHREQINGPTPQRAPLSHRAVLALVHRKYSTRLDGACFELGDAELVPAAGACSSCPHRSGNQPELFADLSKPADVCTKPPCFGEKTLAVWKRAEDRAFELSQRVVPKADAEVHFGHNGAVVMTAPWIEPTAELPYELRVGMPVTAKVPTWAKLLGTKHTVPVVLVQDPTGAPRELLDRAAAIAALIEAGKIDKPSSKPVAASSSKPTAEDRKERAKEKAKIELKEAAFARVLAMVADVDPPDTSKEWLPAVRWLLRTIEPLINLDAREMLGARHDKDLDKLVVDVPNLRAAFALLAEMLVAEQCDAVLRGVGKKTNFEAALTLFKVDWEKAQSLAKAAADAEKKSDAAKKKPAKAGAKS